ncbi:methyltransferase family protein [Hyphococcus sp.]|uniref:methyltransferase family protein n=1 Tax=Hyphococcus sp. TaxID=2038636 RepID=UPI003CCC41BB
MVEPAPRPSFLVIIPPPVWALLFLLTAVISGRLLDLNTPLQNVWLGAVVFAIGFSISASGRIAFARAKTEVVPVSEKNSALVTGGPFRYSRNPMYLGILIAVAGLALMAGTWAALFAIPAFFLFTNFISIPYEEEKMERQFSETYRAYKSKVRRWL